MGMITLGSDGGCTEAEKLSKYSAPRSSSSITPSGRWEPTTINFRVDTTEHTYRGTSRTPNICLGHKPAIDYVPGFNNNTRIAWNLGWYWLGCLGAVGKDAHQGSYYRRLRSSRRCRSPPSRLAALVHQRHHEPFAAGRGTMSHSHSSMSGSIPGRGGGGEGAPPAVEGFSRRRRPPPRGLLHRISQPAIAAVPVRLHP